MLNLPRSGQAAQAGVFAASPGIIWLLALTSTSSVGVGPAFYSLVKVVES